MPQRVVRRRRDDDDDGEGEDGFDPQDDDEGDEPPRRGSRGVKGSTSSTRRPTRSRDEEERRPVRKGWGGARRVKEMGGDFPEGLTLEAGEPVLVKFLEDEPFVSYRQHWIEREGKKSWTCLEDDCPLCDIGDRPQSKFCFNVLLLSEGEPVVKVWTVGSRVLSTLEAHHQDKKTGPLTKLYWEIKRTGKGTKSSTNLQGLKERDVEEDWEDVELLDDDVLEKYRKQCYTDETVQVQTRKQLKEIASEIADDDD